MKSHHNTQIKFDTLVRLSDRMYHFLFFFCLISFLTDNISGYSGVAICGDRPFFVFLSKHGELHSYRLSNNTPITGFAAFNTVNCANGLIYFDQNCDLKIATFPKHQIFDGDWLVQKVPLHSSPRHIVYHLERKLYCFVKVSQSVTGTFCRFSCDGLSLETVQNKIDKRCECLKKFDQNKIKGFSSIHRADQFSRPS